ncbi:hypothetical protein HPB51_024827 [Rhipicephalus microplus]|uniref:VWFA domain-containing protein n=1 Tax=Rhipicephalus microplus TaxID=6941 RepID=A0A9J6F899_RHIMP|nr:hypothetical protein HPB51_024827 [Rhipicephalus microplus]
MFDADTFLSLEQVLQSGGAEGSAMLLITDGAENEPPFISQVLPLLLQKKIMLYALAVTTDAEDSLDKAARDTGGRAFTTAGSEDVVTCIADVIASAAIEQLEEGTRPVTIEIVNRKKSELIEQEDGKTFMPSVTFCHDYSERTLSLSVFSLKNEDLEIA